MLLVVLTVPQATYGQGVVTNITETQTPGLDLGTNVDTVGSTTQITGGTRSGDGAYLFHSLDFFTLGTDHIAHFMNDMQLPTTYIFARVIGGEASTIDGTVQTNNPLNPLDPMNFGAANLWLVNPSGVLLGPNARVDVGGSVSFSTANYLRFFDGITTTLFDMLSAPESLGLLNVAPVVAFGFVGSNPGAIAVQGSQFSVTDGQGISLVGGTISIESGTPEGGTAQPVQLSAPNGRIQLATTASPGEFDVNTLQSLPNVDGTSFVSFESVSLMPSLDSLVPDSIIGSDTSMVFIKDGQIVLSVKNATLSTSDVSPAPSDTIFLSSGSSIVTSNFGSGSGADVQITAGNLNLNGSAITSDNLGFGVGLGGNVNIQVADKVTLSNGSSITTRDFSLEGEQGENGGDVVIVATDVELQNGSINTVTFGPGRGGNVDITANFLTLENNAEMKTETSFQGEVGGDLLLNVGELHLTGGDIGGSKIKSTNETVIEDPAVNGKGGNITIQGMTGGANSAADLVELSGGSEITSGALSGSGGGGQISIRATSLDLKEASLITSSTSAFGIDLDDDGVLDDATARAGGDILVAVRNLRVLEGSTITSFTALGEVLAVAGGAVTVEVLGVPGSQADSVELSGQGTGIFSASNVGVPGNITVNTGTLTITNGAVITTGSDLSGPAGNMAVTADSVVISTDGQIASRTFTQNAGQVIITANRLTLDNGSIVTSTSSEILGRGGDVVLNGGTVSLTNGASINSQSELTSNGRAGDITITGLSLTMANQSEITSSSLGADEANAGDAGNINIRSGSTVLLNNSAITTEATASSGGQITINAPEMIRLTNSEVSTSVKGGSGDSDGGNISIDPQFVILQNSQLVAQANAGAGGAINVIAGVFIADPSTLVSASSESGPQGTVNIQSPVQNIGGELAALSDEFASAAALLAQQCAARVADGKFSTFVIAGREGLPLEPGGFLASPSLTSELVGSRLSGRDPYGQLSPVTGLFPKYEVRPIQLAKLGNTCH